MIANYHTHTPRCHHAVGAEEEYVCAAIDAGLQILGFSDHTPQLFPGDYVSRVRMLPHELTEYVQTIRDLEEKYADKIKLHVGVEAEYYPACFADTLKLLKSAGVEYMILGSHWLGNEEGEPYCGAATEDEERLAAYCDRTIEAMATGLFTYLAHPDLINFVGDAEIYRKHMRRICEASLAYAVPLEINILGIYTNRHYPNPVFWELAGQMGCSVVVGMDAHRPEGLCVPDAMNYAMELVEKYDLNLLETVTLRPL